MAENDPRAVATPSAGEALTSHDALAREVETLRLENAQLKLANEALVRESERDHLEDEKRIGRLELMFEVAGRVASTLDPKELLQTIMADATRVMGAEASALMLVDESTGDLVFEVALGEKGEQVKAIRVKKGQGIAGWVAEHKQTLLVPDVDKDPRHAKQISRSVGFHAQSMLCSPLLVGDEVIGIVQVINKKAANGLSFDEDDIKVFEAFADQSATAISQARAHQDVKDLFENTIRMTSGMLDARDEYTRGHSERVTDFALAIADEVGLPAEQREDLRLSGLLHDIGKIGVRDDVLLKPGKLTDEEYEKMKRHPVIGYNIVKGTKQLSRTLDGIRHHHERIDGRGYPDGLKGDEIPLQGRILAVADCFDAMTSNRAYRPAFDAARALTMMSETRGTQHDPRFVDALISAHQRGKIIEQARRPKPPSQLSGESHPETISSQ